MNKKKLALVEETVQKTINDTKNSIFLWKVVRDFLDYECEKRSIMEKEEWSATRVIFDGAIKELTSIIERLEVINELLGIVKKGG